MSDGVFITKGMTFSLGSFSLTIDDDGNIIGSPVVPQLSFDVCPVWIKLAHDHLDEAHRRKAETLSAWASGDGDRKSEALEREFESAMQAVSAAVIAIDSLYAWLKPHAGIDEATQQKWRDGRTARYKQVAEVFRRSFKLNDDSFNWMLDTLGKLYGLRDRVVHPQAKAEEAALRPDLNVGVEWRFALYCADGMNTAVLVATGLVYRLTRSKNAANEQVRGHMERLRERLELLFPSGHPVETLRAAEANSGTDPAAS